MQLASPFLAAHEPQHRGPEIWEFAEICLQRTAGAILEIRVATPHEISQAISTARESHARGMPSDLLETLARIQNNGEDDLADAMLDLGNQVAATLNPYAPLIPFGGKLMAPTAFYDSFESLHELARALLSPVIYAEDTDAIGTASANPVASAILADEIRNTVFKRFGIRPFVSIARLDYESWISLSRKHFGL